jgi:hypothetical protein
VLLGRPARGALEAKHERKHKTWDDNRDSIHLLVPEMFLDDVISNPGKLFLTAADLSQKRLHPIGDFFLFFQN